MIAVADSIPAGHKASVYRPRGGARELFLCRDPEVLLDGPAGTGKSRSILEYLLAIATKYPGARLAIVRKTRVSCTDSALVTWETKVLAEGVDRNYLKVPLVSGPSRATRHSYEFKNGSVIDVHGMDNPTRLFSTEYDIIYVQEATELTENEWESLHRALRNGVVPFQQLVGDCNPDSELHWLNLRCNKGQTTRILSRHEDNPSLDAAYLTRLSNLTGVRRKRLYEGKWVSAEGQIWENFDLAVHVRNPSEAPHMGDKLHFPGGVIAGVDWGFRNAGTCLVGGVDFDGRIWIIEEIYRCGPSIADEIDRSDNEEDAEEGVFNWWIRQFLRVQNTWGISHFAADPSQPESIDRCRRKGVKMKPANNALEDGLNCVRDRLDKRADGTRGLYFLSTMRGTADPLLRDAKRPTSVIEEIPSYVWAEWKEGRQPKEEPSPGCDDHGCDGLRYLCMQVDRYGLRGEAEEKKYPRGSMYYLGGHAEEEERQELERYGLLEDGD